MALAPERALAGGRGVEGKAKHRGSGAGGKLGAEPEQRGHGAGGLGPQGSVGDGLRSDGLGCGSGGDKQEQERKGAEAGEFHRATSEDEMRGLGGFAGTKHGKYSNELDPISQQNRAKAKAAWRGLF